MRNKTFLTGEQTDTERKINWSNSILLLLGGGVPVGGGGR